MGAGISQDQKSKLSRAWLKAQEKLVLGIEPKAQITRAHGNLVVTLPNSRSFVIGLRWITASNGESAGLPQLNGTFTDFHFSERVKQTIADLAPVDYGKLLDQRVADLLYNEVKHA